MNSSLIYTPKWLYDIMGEKSSNPHNPHGWNKYIKNNYDIRNIIFSYVPSNKKIFILYSDIPYQRSITIDYKEDTCIYGDYEIRYVPIVIFKGEEKKYDSLWSIMPEVD